VTNTLKTAKIIKADITHRHIAVSPCMIFESASLTVYVCVCGKCDMSVCVSLSLHSFDAVS